MFFLSGDGSSCAPICWIWVLFLGLWRIAIGFCYIKPNQYSTQKPGKKTRKFRLAICNFACNKLTVTQIGEVTTLVLAASCTNCYALSNALISLFKKHQALDSIHHRHLRSLFNLCHSLKIKIPVSCFSSAPSTLFNKMIATCSHPHISLLC